MLRKHFMQRLRNYLTSFARTFQGYFLQFYFFRFMHKRKNFILYILNTIVPIVPFVAEKRAIPIDRRSPQR